MRQAFALAHVSAKLGRYRRTLIIATEKCRRSGWLEAIQFMAEHRCSSANADLIILPSTIVHFRVDMLAFQNARSLPLSKIPCAQLKIRYRWRASDSQFKGKLMKQIGAGTSSGSDCRCLHQFMSRTRII